MTMKSIDTPAVLIDAAVMEKNIHAMAGLCRANALTLRPHIKTHKSAWLARRQLAAGATGIAVAKLGEAEVMAAQGIKDIQIANEIVSPQKLERLKHLHNTARLTVCTDSLNHAELLSDKFKNERNPLPVLIEINTGLNRAGLTNPEDVLTLAKTLAALPGLCFSGLMTHAGHAYGADSPEKVAEIGHGEGETLVNLAQLLSRHNLTPAILSAGSTPTAVHVAAVPGLTELRVGNYIFNDLTQVRLGVCSLEDCALTVLGTVISLPEGGNRVILDTGSKILTSDKGAHASQTVTHFGYIPEKNTYLSRLSEEHGIIDAPAAPFSLGEKVRIVPNHACPVMNLVDEAYLADGDKVIRVISIDARGKIT